MWDFINKFNTVYIFLTSIILSVLAIIKIKSRITENINKTITNAVSNNRVQIFYYQNEDCKYSTKAIELKRKYSQDDKWETNLLPESDLEETQKHLTEQAFKHLKHYTKSVSIKIPDLPVIIYDNNSFNDPIKIINGVNEFTLITALTMNANKFYRMVYLIFTWTKLTLSDKYYDQFLNFKCSYCNQKNNCQYIKARINFEKITGSK